MKRHIPNDQLRLFWRYSHDGASDPLEVEQAWESDDGIHVKVAPGGAPWADIVRGWLNLELADGDEWRDAFASYHSVEGVLRKREIREGGEREIIFPKDAPVATEQEAQERPARQERLVRALERIATALERQP